MTVKHTSGPWEFIRKYADNSGSIKASDGRGIAAIASSVNRPSDEKLGNANLIAAAPDLLQELINIASAKPSTWEDPSEFKAWAQSRAQAAINKATEESK